jgi:hypothetical protein
MGLLMLVTLAALGLGAWQRQREFARRAADHADQQRRCLASEIFGISPCRLGDLLDPTHPGAADVRRVKAQWRALRIHHAAMQRKYDDAARQPWQWVAADPSQPAEPAPDALDRIAARWR